MIISEENISKEIKMLKKLQRKIRADKGIKRAVYTKSDNKQFLSYQKRANAKGFGFELTEEDFNNIHELRCAYCGDEATGFDRVDSKIGYLKSNITPCCASCNMMKNAVNVKDFISKIKQIHDYLNL